MCFNGVFAISLIAASVKSLSVLVLIRYHALMHGFQSLGDGHKLADITIRIDLTPQQARYLKVGNFEELEPLVSCRDESALVLILPHDPIVLHLDVFNLRSQVVHFRLAMVNIVTKSLKCKMGVVIRVRKRMRLLDPCHFLNKFETISVNLFI